MQITTQSPVALFDGSVSWRGTLAEFFAANPDEDPQIVIGA